MTLKKRKYGDLTNQAFPQTDPSLIEDVFRAFTGQSKLTVPSESEETIPPPNHNPPRLARSTVLPNDTVVKNNTVSLDETINDIGLDEGYIKVSYYVSDILAPQLTPTQWAIYYRLYRLSHGIGKNECLIGNKRLRELTGVKETAVRDAIVDLKRLGLVETLEVINTANLKGTRYRINIIPSPEGDNSVR